MGIDLLNNYGARPDTVIVCTWFIIMCFIYILHSYLCQTNLSFDVDINECDVDKGGCSDVCENSIGSFQCSCFSGFELQENLRNCSGEFCSGTEVMQ